MAKKKKSFLLKIFISLFVITLLGVGAGVYWILKKPNVSLGDKKSKIIYIKTGSSFEDVLGVLYDNNVLINRTSFEWLAERKNYKKNIKPGKYRVLARMGNNELINLLRAGVQEPVDIILSNIRTKEQLVSRVCLRLEADSIEMSDKLNDNTYMGKYGFNSANAIALFIPNTYQFYWNTSADQFMDRMAKEYKKFWTDGKKQKAKETGLSQADVITLASIVQAEQYRFNDEKKIIAGLYLNRLKIKMPLQSDPTLIFASGNFSICRVLNEDKEIDSPYNTYKNSGLPPGPICLPELSSVDAVLNYQPNNYIYMCAKEDFSGRHNFSKTLDQHNIFAAKYRVALNKKNIKR